MKRKIFIGIACALHIMLFAYAALAKLADYSNFQFGLSESPFIAPMANVLAWAVPASELVIVVMLAIPVFRLAGLYASFVLMFLFTVYISAMLAFGTDIPCSCGGVLEDLSWPAHIVFNSFFVLLSAIAIWLQRQQKRKPLLQTI